MKKTLWMILAITFLLILSLGAQSQQQTRKRPTWAFPAIERPPAPDEAAEPRTLPGSTKTYTPAQIDDLSNPPDWYPDQHPPAPQIVQKGHGQALACGSCHLMSGVGHPESADLAGLEVTYLLRQMADFKSGARRDPARMNGIAKALSDDEIRQATAWFARLKPKPWTKVIEAGMVPKTYVGQGRMRFATPDGAMEPIGNRIITVPQDQTRARSRDPNTGFIAYVPVGSIKRGEALVEGGGSGKTVPCGICHGDTLHGLADVPRIAGLHPIYIVRQLYFFQDGERAGLGAELMKKAVAQLTDEDIVDIAAYVASQTP